MVSFGGRLGAEHYPAGHTPPEDLDSCVCHVSLVDSSPRQKHFLSLGWAATMAITVTQGAVNNSPYDVSGNTLADIWTDIQAKGPKYKGATRAGLTRCELNMDSQSSKIEVTATQAGKGFEAEAKMTQGTMTYVCTIQAPNLTSKASLSDPAKQEWDRFMKLLMAHENDHVAEFGKEATLIGSEIDSLTASGKGADKKSAQQAAATAYTNVFTTKYSKAETAKRLAARSDALDAGGHGPTLNTGIK
jgi:predicted secreted Zn-dependent protease